MLWMRLRSESSSFPGGMGGVYHENRVAEYLLHMHLPRIAFVPLALALCAAHAMALGVLERAPQLHGTVIPHPSPAPDFTLTDQDGRPFHMSGTRGKVVVMSFIYTHCTDLCPFVTEKLKAARGLLGPDADKAVFVAVTTDPKRDTQEVISAYTKSAGLEGAWRFLTGPAPAVKAVWFDYGVGVDLAKPAPAKEGEARDAEPSQGLAAADLDRARSLADAFGGGYEVAHSTPIWIIDRAGKIRAAMDADALPSDIAENVRALAGR